jgi:hypothetical protein
VTVATFSSFNVGIVQHLPTAVADTLGAVAGVETLVTVSKLLSNDSDQDGDSIAMTAVSSTSVRGGTVRFVTNNAIVSVSYRLNTNANFNVPDSFTYTIRDSAGLTSVGTVNVTITSPGAQTQNLISATPLAGGVVAVQFRGIIGVNYNIQASSDLVTWATIGQATPNALGLITFLDTTAGTAVQRFYRTQVPAP